MGKALAFAVLTFIAWPGGPVLAQTKPADFSAQMAIETEAGAPFYRFAVPLDAYLQSAHGDLRDLRVFDSAGQIVPHARLAAADSTQETRRHANLPWFPLSAQGTESAAAATDGSLDVVVKQAADGTLVEIKSQGGKPMSSSAKPQASALRGYVLDASQVADRVAVRSLELDWDRRAGDFQLLDIEASDDLRQWRSLRTGVQLARLTYEGSRIENRRVDLSGLRERYLRLIWRNPANAPQLTQAEVELVSSSFAGAPMAWSSPVAAGTPGPHQGAGEYNYHLPQPLPLMRLRLELPAGNVLLPVAVLQPDRQHRYAHPVANTVAYRILENGREWTQDEISLDGRPIQDFVLRIDPRGGTAGPGPALAFALEPAQVIFLAGGTPPYTLAIGNKKAVDSALSPRTLIPGFGTPQSPQIKEARVLVAERPAAAPANAPAKEVPGQPDEPNWKKLALWGVLAAGVLGMAVMAWQLLRQMNRPEQP